MQKFTRWLVGMSTIKYSYQEVQEKSIIVLSTLWCSGVEKEKGITITKSFWVFLSLVVLVDKQYERRI